MHDAPRIDPLEANPFFEHELSARPLPAGTVARGFLRDDVHLYQGKTAAGDFAGALPESLPLSRELLERGRQRYEIFCSVCHDSTGQGRGMIVRRGFKQPPAYTDDRLMAMPIGYFFDVITNGFGVMSSYASRIPVEDRWAIAAYVRVLQLSQKSRLDDLPPRTVAAFRAALARPDAPAHDEEHH
ncbi:MAG: cytochrome c [Acidobacteria bacterium]|nr:MAG: cytochrome c [Acidobacteriota bacterium]